MVKLVGDAAGLTRRVFKQSAYIYTKNGQAYMNSWPRPASGPVSQKLQDSRDLMRQRSIAIKAMPFRLTDFSTRYSQHTMLMPRDWLFMGLAGRYMQIWLPPDKLAPGTFLLGAEGQPPAPEVPPDYDPNDSVGRLRPIYSMAALDDLSFLLDIYGEATGTTIYRTVQGWRGLAPGEPGQVLTVQPDKSLAWGAGGGGGAGGYQKTILAITTPPGSAIADPFYLEWQTAIIDDLGAWDPATPERIRLPDDVLFYRVGLTFHIAAPLTVDDLLVSLRNYPSGASFSPAPYWRCYKGTGAFGNMFINGTSSFLPPPEDRDLQVRVNDSQQTSITIIQPVYLTIEAIRAS